MSKKANSEQHLSLLAQIVASGAFLTFALGTGTATIAQLNEFVVPIESL
jgi:hypothetical protein